MSERSAKLLFWVAGIYGVIVTVPNFFNAAQFSAMYPPALTHLEFYYGFTSLAVAWQVAFLIIATNPLKYRLLIFPSILEKGFFSATCLWLLIHGQLPALLIPFFGIDALLCVLFTIAFIGLTPKDQPAKPGHEK